MSDNDQQNRARLPGAVYDLAMRLGVKPNDLRPSVRLTQTGHMKRKLGTEAWMNFTATQTISARACDFEWRARAGPLGTISAIDALKNGEARFDILALGFVPIARAENTSALIRSELMRYLAEIVWAPDAILLNKELNWREDAPGLLAVSAGTGERAAEIVFSLNDEGRIASAFAPDRPRSATSPVLPTPWRGRFSGYRLHNSIWLPFAGEVAWEIEGKPETYWKGRIEHWESSEESV